MPYQRHYWSQHPVPCLTLRLDMPQACLESFCLSSVYRRWCSSTDLQLGCTGVVHSGLAGAIHHSNYLEELPDLKPVGSFDEDLQACRQGPIESLFHDVGLLVLILLCTRCCIGIRSPATRSHALSSAPWISWRHSYLWYATLHGQNLKQA